MSASPSSYSVSLFWCMFPTLLFCPPSIKHLNTSKQQSATTKNWNKKQKKVSSSNRHSLCHSPHSTDFFTRTFVFVFFDFERSREWRHAWFFPLLLQMFVYFSQLCFIFFFRDIRFETPFFASSWYCLPVLAFVPFRGFSFTDQCLCSFFNIAIPVSGKANCIFQRTRTRGPHYSLKKQTKNRNQSSERCSDFFISIDW